MKKIIQSQLIIGLIVILLLVGCGKNYTNQGNPNEQGVSNESLDGYVFPDIPNKYLHIFADHADYTFTGYSVINSLFFTVISDSLPKTTEIDVSFDVPIECTATLEMNEKPDFLPYGVFVKYQKDVDKVITEDEYNLIEESKLPKLYSGKLIVNLTDVSKFSEMKIHEMTVLLDNEKYNFKLENISINNSIVPKASNDDLMLETLAIADINVTLPEEESVFIQELIVTASKDVEIMDVVCPFNKNTVIESVEVYEKTSGFNYMWDMSKSLQIKEGETISLSMTLKDPAFAKSCSVNRTVLIEYDNYEEISETFVDISIRSRVNAFEMFQGCEGL